MADTNEVILEADEYKTSREKAWGWSWLILFIISLPFVPIGVVEYLSPALGIKDQSIVLVLCVVLSSFFLVVGLALIINSRSKNNRYRYEKTISIKEKAKEIHNFETIFLAKKFIEERKRPIYSSNAHAIRDMAFTGSDRFNYWVEDREGRKYCVSRQMYHSIGEGESVEAKVGEFELEDSYIKGEKFVFEMKLDKNKVKEELPLNTDEERAQKRATNKEDWKIAFYFIIFAVVMMFVYGILRDLFAAIS